MFGLQLPELLVILGIILLVFGAARLPEIARAIGRSLGAFKKGLKDTEDEVKKLGEEPPKEEDKK